MRSKHSPLQVDEEGQKAMRGKNCEGFHINCSSSSTFMFILLLGALAFFACTTNISFHYSTSTTSVTASTNSAKIEEQHNSSTINITSLEEPTGPYKLIEKQEGLDFFDYYNFYDGPDSLGSAGYNTYVSKEEAEKLNIFDVEIDPVKNEEFIFMKSSPTSEGPRSSIRLEGKNRFDRGLFIIDLRHMPNGAGVWPAFWLTVSEI